MGGDFIVFAFDKVKDDVGGESTFSLFVAEPLPAGPISAFDDAALVFDGAVGAGVGGDIFLLRLRGTVI